MKEKSLLSPCYGTAYIRHKNGQYFAIRDGLLCLSNTPFLWQIEAYENNRFYLKNSAGYMLAEYWWGTLKSAVDSGYTEQHWYLYTTCDGELFIEHADSQGKFLRKGEEGNLTIGECCEESAFFLENASLTEGVPYIEVIGATGFISLRLDPTIYRLANRQWLQRWANALEDTAYAMSRLVGWVPAPRIEIRAYTNCSAWGYVFCPKPIVHVNRRCMEEDIEKMRQRDSLDLSFGVLHEISHLFDKANWMFDGEALANLKLPYALRIVGATASPAEFSAFETFSGDRLYESLYHLDGRIEERRGRFCASFSAKLMEVADKAGWNALAKTFYEMEHIEGESRFACFQRFLTCWGKHAGMDVYAMFSSREWEIIQEELSK